MDSNLSSSAFTSVSSNWSCANFARAAACESSRGSRIGRALVPTPDGGEEAEPTDACTASICGAKRERSRWAIPMVLAPYGALAKAIRLLWPRGRSRPTAMHKT